jgi:2-dehydro-3-deoxyphosphooctonate aldolase (KDO 8-P synthase)
MAGPCVVESEDTTRRIAGELKEVCCKHSIPMIFKASYRKANRTRFDSFAGIGDELALEILARIGQDYNVPIMTDIHTPHEAERARQHVDILQIPAFLCRQTDLLLAAGDTGLPVNIKKGQFVSPETMRHVIQKVIETGNTNVIITERGTTFGYNDLVVDFRGIPTMRSFGYPVVVDLTHSLQKPNQSSGVTGGDPQLIETMGKAAIAVGTDGIFIETHPNPSEAISDGKSMLQLNVMEPLLTKLLRIRQAVSEH